MTDQNLLTLFVAVTALAVLIQTGIVAGLYFASLKISRQADRAAIEARKLVEPVHRMVNTLETTSNHLVEMGASTRDNVLRWEHQINQFLESIRRKVA